MISKLTVAVLALTVYIVTAQSSLSLPVTQDFAVANSGLGAQVTRPSSLSFFNNGFQSSIAYFGVDLSPLALYDTSTIVSATLTFKNYAVREASATIGVTLLNYGQVFDEDAVTLNTQPTSQGRLGSVTFDATTGVATLDVKNQLKAAHAAGGLFGFRVDPPGGPVTVASHREDANSVYVAVVFGSSPQTDAPATSTSTAAPVPSAPNTPSTTTPNAPVPNTPSTQRVTTTTTRAPATPSTAGPSQCWSCGPGYVHWYNIEGMAKPSDPCACVAQGATALPTQSLPGGSTSAPTAAGSGAPSTEQPRSAANKVSAALLCIVPLAMAILL